MPRKRLYTPEEAERRNREGRQRLCAARRERLRAAGLCLECGGSRAAAGATTIFCASCAARRRALLAARRGRGPTPKRPALPETDPDAPAVPQCPHCGGAHLTKAGHDQLGRRRFRCKDCGATSRGLPKVPAAAVTLPCSYCGRQCYPAGKNRRGRGKYYCPVCRRQNTNLWPANGKSPGGPFPWRKTFCLDLVAHDRLIRYCNAAGMSVAQAIRDIFRIAARPPVMAFGRRVYDENGRLLEIEVESYVITRPPINLHVRIPSATSEATRRMASQRGDAFHRPTVYVSARISVALDDLAWEGLLRTMQQRGLTSQQEAARWLVRNARMPERRR